MKRTIKNRTIGIFSFAAGFMLVAGIGMQNVLASAETVDEEIIAPMTIALVDGAACRVVDEDTSGLKFTARINAEYYSGLDTEEVDVKAGMIIVPKDFVAAAGAATHEALATLGVSIADQKTTLFKQATDSEGVSYLEYSLTITNIKDNNYTRDFVPIAYIETTNLSTEEVTYEYAGYTEEDNVRNVYEIAKAAYNDRQATSSEKYGESVTYQDKISYSPYKSNALDVMKGYLDGVVELQKEDGIVTISNNSNYYQSPYSLEAKGDLYQVKSSSSFVKGMVYNNQRQAGLSVRDGAINVDATVANGASLNNDNSVTLKGLSVPAANRNPASLAKVGNSYVGFGGNYGAGTKVEFTFTGKNMPTVMLFADAMNGNWSNSGGSGLLLFNGGVTEGTGQQNSTSMFMVYGPNRVANFWQETIAFRYKTWGSAALEAFYLDSLVEENEYTYTVEMYDNAETNTVWVKMTLVNATTETTATFEFDSTFATGSTGNIVAYAPMKGAEVDTTFSYTEPVVEVEAEPIPNSSGATRNEDGSVTLEGLESLVANRNPASLTAVSNSYVAFEGEYGAKAKVEFTFTGKNMPTVMLFADNINGDWSKNGGAGLLLFNGGVTAGTGQQNSTSMFMVYGPNRVSSYWQETIAFRYKTWGSAALEAFYLDSLVEGNEYTYTVEMYDNAETSTVWVKMTLVNATTETTATFEFDSKFATGSTGNIIAYAPMKGAEVDTTFSYTEPVVEVEPEPIPNSNGATRNEDGSVTLEGLETIAANRNPANVSAVSNSYVAFEGDYGANTKVEFNFTGKNMPTVMLFADNINGDWSKNGGAGLLLFNGGVTAGTGQHNTMSMFMVYGPNRISNYWQENILFGYKALYGQHAKLTPFYLDSLVEGNEYTYTVEMYDNAETSTVWVKMTLVNATAESSTVYEFDSQFATGSVGNIIAYAPMKGAGIDTTFCYAEPEIVLPPEPLPTSNGATRNQDGSVTLEGQDTLLANLNPGNLKLANNSYVAFEGDYGSGTKVEFTFTGKNMPTVMLFADNINGDWSKNGGTGLLLLNGAVSSATAKVHNSLDWFFVFGQNRLSDIYTTVVWYNNGGSTQLQPFCQGSLEDGKEYKYTIEMYDNAETSTVWVKMTMENLTDQTTSTFAFNSTYATGSAGNIIAYAPMKGAGEDTTFFYKAPDL